MTKQDTIYQQRILDHYKNPSNYGVLENANQSERGINPLCGDEVEFKAVLKNNHLKEIKFTAKGCAISIASASLLTEAIRSKGVEEISNYNQQDHLKNLGIQLTPLRLKCALLPLMTLQQLVKN